MPGKSAVFTFSLPARSAIPGLVASPSLNLHLNETSVDRERLLLALAGQESNFGRMCGLRTEPGYSPGGKYYKDSPFQKAAFLAYGKAACGSWGPWQILYPTAWELGFRGQPWELFGAATCLTWAIALINRRILPAIPPGLSEEKFLAKFADAYNTGSWKKGLAPAKYITELWGHYQKPLAELRAEFNP